VFCVCTALTANWPARPRMANPIRLARVALARHPVATLSTADPWARTACSNLSQLSKPWLGASPRRENLDSLGMWCGLGMARG
jgi:hypothetical protein